MSPHHLRARASRLPILRCRAVIASGMLASGFICGVAPPTFLPGPGTQVERTFSWELTSKTVDLELLLNREETTVVPKARTKHEVETSITVTDTFTRSTVNQHLELTRKFDDITYEGGGKLDVELEDGSRSRLKVGCIGGSELDGVAVQFIWDGAAEEYRSSTPRTTRAKTSCSSRCDQTLTF